MTWINAEKIADKIDGILANNKVLPSEWRYAVPTHLVQAPIPVVINARNLARGILEAVEKYHPDLDAQYPEPTDPYSERY